MFPSLTKKFMNCLFSALPFLLLFQIPILIHRRNTGEKVLWPHFIMNLLFVEIFLLHHVTLLNILAALIWTFLLYNPFL